MSHASPFSRGIRVLTFVFILFAIISTGFFLSPFDYFWNYQQQGPPPEPTLSDYDAVTSIELAGDQSVRVVLSDDPRFATIGSMGDYKVTHLALTSADGTVNKRAELTPGQKAAIFDITGTGKYTLALIHHEPANPGLFGSSEWEDSQLVKFRVTEMTVLVTGVPDEASNWDSDVDKMETQ